MIHDGVRPAIDEKLILENIVTARSHGNAVTVVNASETILVSHNMSNADELLKREEVYYARAPQTFYLRDIYAAHQKEMEAGNLNNIDSCSIMFKHGYKLYFVKGKSSNIKITTYEDYYIYKALYELEKRQRQGEILE
jgi:2-C-methyl-D-erythritol 4-phosphate cytidylyltransferase